MIAKIIIISIIILISVFILTLFPLLSFMNGLLSHYCKNNPFFTEHEKYQIFPESKIIESNYQNIKKDYLNYNFPIKTFYEMLPEFNVVDIEKQKKEKIFWKVLPLKTTGKIIEPNKSYFPSLKNILQNPMIHNAFFSVLDPKLEIPPHIGYYKGYLRYHLGMIIPKEKERPYIVVGDEKYFWKEGEGVLFDDMFNHYVRNPTSQQRVVLFIDVIRPLTGIINWINKIVIFLIERNPIIKRIQKIQHESIKL